MQSILRQAESYRRDGFVVIPGCVQGSLLERLRREAERGERIARELYGVSARRLGPVRDHGLDASPFQALVDSTVLRGLLPAISPELHVGAHATDPLQLTTLLFMPLDRSRWTYWHRDWRDRIPLDDDAFHAAARRSDMFCCYNLPLWDDDSLWVVPGSHRRNDTSAESAFRVARYMKWSEWDVRTVQEHGEDPEALSLAQQAYLRTMPNASNLRLRAGDLCIWHQGLWHLGAYSPSKHRATVHDAVGSQAMAAYSLATAGERANYYAPVEPIRSGGRATVAARTLHS